MSQRGIGLGQNVPNRIFVEKHLTPISRLFDSSAALAAEVDRYNFGAVIVGSDQVWRPKYARSLLGDFFLGFLSNSRKNTRKISYAASFGSEHDEYGPADKAMAAPAPTRLVTTIVAVSTVWTRTRRLIRPSAADPSRIDP